MPSPTDITTDSTPWVFNNTSPPSDFYSLATSSPNGYNLGLGRKTFEFDFFSNGYFAENVGGHIAVVLRNNFSAISSGYVQGQGIVIGNVSGSPNPPTIPLPPGVPFAPNPAYPSTQIESFWAGVAVAPDSSLYYGNSLLANTNGANPILQDGVAYRFSIVSEIRVGVSYTGYTITQGATVVYNQPLIYDYNAFYDSSQTYVLIGHVFENAGAQPWSFTITNKVVTWSRTLIGVFDINSMQTTARDILGTSNTGYGFTAVVSRPVNNRTIIGASTFNRLLTDTNVISVHQLNVSTSTPAAVVGAVIPASFVNDIHGHLKYLINDNNRYIAHPAQLSALNTTGGVSTRINRWSRMSHIVQASWPTTSTAQWFFNSGGKIELNSSHGNNDSGIVTDTWKTLIDGLGTYTYARPEFVIGNVSTSVYALVGGYPIEWNMDAIKADDAKSIRFTISYIIEGIYNPYFIVSPDAAIWYISLTPTPPPDGGGGGGADGADGADGFGDGFVDAITPSQSGDNGGDAADGNSFA